MKLVTNKRITNLIILLFTFLMLFNFIMPNYIVYADEDSDNGGKLFKPIFKMFAWIGDLVIKGLQKIFIGDGDIKGDGISEIEQEGAFSIRYSPGIIFSNTVPALNANFITPSKKLAVQKVTVNWEQVKNCTLDNVGYEFNKNTMKPQKIKTDGEHYLGIAQFNGRNESFAYSWTYNEKQYMLINTQAGKIELWHDSVLSMLDNITQTSWDKLEEIFGKDWTLYEKNTKKETTGEYLESSSEKLQPIIATWYKALRLIALVGLLSVLVYVGIRILISSTGQEKSKYKKMIVDWVAAVCILFILQYIMSFTMTIVENLINIFKSKVINANGEDILMSSIRENIGNTYQFSAIFTDLIIYLALVVYTCVFTVHYLKRLIYLAFFTMIAPLIALTYPLDKIKDGQAQAFSMWLREYVFNALIPVIHILLYTIFVGSSIDFAKSNPIYALVCIGFLIPAEKFVRKMFGFDKASTSGQLGAAAGGAMVMNAVNKLGHKPSKEGGSDEKGNKVRQTPSYSSGYNGVGGVAGPAAALAGGSNPLAGAGGSNPLAGAGGSNPLAGAGGSNPFAGAGGSNPFAGAGETNIPKKNVGNGVKAVAGKYINRKTPKKIGKLVRKGLTGAAGAAALGTIGLAAGVASGDFGNVAKYAGAGMAAGAYGGTNLGDKAAKLEKSNRDTYNQGGWGKEEYNRRELIKELWQNDDIYKQYGIKGKSNFTTDAREFINGGVTNSEEISAAIKLREKEGMTNSAAVAVAQQSKNISDHSFGDPQKRNKFEKDIANSLRKQGYQGDADKEAARQIRLIGNYKLNLNS